MTAANENLVWDQLPQPARPPNSYDMSLETPSTAYPQQQPIEQNNADVVPVPPTMAKEAEGKRKLGVVDKLVDRVMEKYEKLPESLREQIQMKERKRNNVESECSDSRGLQEPVVEDKLQRFKVRTVLAEEVDVKEDDKK